MISMIQFIQIHRTKYLMSSKYQNKRFQRSFGPYHSSSNQNLLSSTFMSSQQITDRFEYLDKSLNAGGDDRLNILLKLAEIQSLLMEERNDRIIEERKILKTLKQMECKHSSIIYDSQIRYCRSPRKPQIFFSNNRNVKEEVNHNKLNKALSTASLACQQKQNINNSSYMRANKAQILRCSKVYKTKEQNKIEEQGFFDGENPENVDKTKTSSILRDIQDQIKKLPFLIDSTIQCKINQKTEEFNRRLAINEEEILKIKLDFDYKSQIKVETNNLLIEKHIKELMQAKHQSFAQIHRTQQLVQQLQHSFGNGLKQVFEQVQNQRNQIRLSKNANKTHLDSYQKQILQIQRYLEQKISWIEIQKTNNEKFQKSIMKNMQDKLLKSKELENQKNRQTRQMMSNIQENLHRQTDLIKFSLSKQIQSRCMKIEEEVTGAIEKHIGFLQNFIRQVEKNQEIIMTQYVLSQDENKLRRNQIRID